MNWDYKKAGVNIQAADSLVSWLKKSSQTTDHMISDKGDYGALFRVPFLSQMKSPCLVSSTDGVGTKLKLAFQFKSYESVGQDLVAMCVNDVICTGAKPLFFLDYYATGILEPPLAQAFLTGVQKACLISGCPLVGGETAEMPDFYKKGEFDCAGFVVGVVDEEEILGPHRVEVGDKLLGVSSSGFHSNGYSLLRKLFERDLEDWKETLITPTFVYAPLFQSLKKEKGLKALAHITGGGFDNLLRVLPYRGLLKPWPVPLCFQEVQRRSHLSWEQMLKTFNCGVGLVLVVSSKTIDVFKNIILKAGFKTYDLGDVTSGSSSWQIDLLQLEEKLHEAHI